MSDFQDIDRKRKNKPDKKARHLCLYDGCDAIWTHSDAFGGIGYCGYHYYWGKGKAELDAWKLRNAQSIRDRNAKREHGVMYPECAPPSPASRG